MRLWELFEVLDHQEIKDIETVLNNHVFMPKAAVASGKAVLKLVLPTSQHFGGRATANDLSGRRPEDATDYTGSEVRKLLVKARTDQSMGYADDLTKLASWEGPGDYPATGSGYQLFDPESRVRIPVVVKPNPAAKKLVGKTTVMTDRGLEPRNLLKAKTIMRDRPGKKDPIDSPNKAADLHSLRGKPAFKAGVKVNNFTPMRRAPKRDADYDDGL